MSTDEPIQLTNNDATNFKAYAVNKGYWQDPYISHFSSSIKSQQQFPPNEHKPPEMSRGYFARVHAIRSLVNKFLEKYEDIKCQIVNLGAGYDTLYFDLLDKNKLPFKYVEIDFSRVVTSKIRILRTKKALADKIFTDNKPKVVESKKEEPTASQEAKPGLFALPTLPPPSIPPATTEIHTQIYHLISADLRNTNELNKKLTDCELDFSLPTLVISECVLVYMNSEHSHSLLKYLSSTFKYCCFLNYEQCNLNDRFGEIMLANMQNRACKLLGVESCGSIETQINRFADCGFLRENFQIITMTDYYLNKIEKSERDRIESIEFLDEKELLIQLLDHYCICIAENNSNMNHVTF